VPVLKEGKGTIYRSQSNGISGSYFRVKRGSSMIHKI
jgi:hypothetical protein